MDVSGIVIAASEIIRFENGLGIMLTVCNTFMNFYFYILAKDALIKLWKKIFVNHFYNFSDLNIGAAEWLSGTRRIVLVATLKTGFQEILEHEQQKISISNNLMKIISIPEITFNSEIHSFSKLISYQGVVTKIKDQNLGMYEIDKKVHLYCTFNLFHSLLPAIKVGNEVFISNAHFFTDFKGRKILVCCGLSSVRSFSEEENVENAFILTNLSHYSLSIFDIIWLEMLFVKLNTRFCSTVISSDFIFDSKNEIINKILECFTNLSFETACSIKVVSLGDEYCSNPHSCRVFCKDSLPTGCEISCISEILDKVASRISWTENSDSWKTCFIKNHTKYILIGMLYLAKDGSWYIMDESSDIPVIFTQSCSQCKFLKNTLCSYDNLNLSYLIALQNFEIVCEKVKYKSSIYNYYRYLKTSPCYFFHLGSFSKEKDNLFHAVSFNDSSTSKYEHCSSIDKITESLKHIHLNKQDLLTNVQQDSYIPLYHEDLINNNPCQYFLVLNKIWTVIDQAFVCYQVLVLLLPQEEIHEKYFNKSRSLFEDTSNFYETDDDYEFANLVNQMDSLFLEDAPKLARLHFESTRQCALIVPGHIYTVDFSENFIKEAKFSVSDKSSLKPVLIKIKSNMKILHHEGCIGSHCPEDYMINVFTNISEIIHKRKLQENYLIRAVLKDKYFEECSGSRNSSSDVDVDRTFCFILKDCSMEDSLKVYLPFCPRNMYGFLPGIQLQLYGFVCVCSKRGYLYLTPSSSFGMQIITSQQFDFIKNSSDIQDNDSHLEAELRISSLQCVQANVFFKCLCFIVRIISAKLFLICNNCGKEFEKKCSCFCNYSVKLTVSFIVDDGTEQMLVYSSDEAARKILMLNKNELEKLASFVTDTKTHLNFHYETIEETTDSSLVIAKVFNIYCSSQSLYRQICIKCKKASDGLKNERKIIWCYDVLKVQETNLIPDYLIKLKNISI